VKIEGWSCRRLAAGGRVLPILQRVLDRVHQQWVPAENFHVLDLAVRRDHYLNFYNSGQAKLPRGLRIGWRRIVQRLPVLLGVHARSSQPQCQRKQNLRRSLSRFGPHGHLSIFGFLVVQLAFGGDRNA